MKQLRKNPTVQSLQQAYRARPPGVKARARPLLKDAVIEPEHLPEEIQASKEGGRRMVVELGSSLKDIERETIRRTLAEVTNHREQAAKLLGISLRALQYKIKEYGIRE